MAQPDSATVRVENAGSEKGLSAYALELSPVERPVPVKTTEPIPADIRPGSRISGSIGPPSPAASMRMIAPMTGEPKMAAIAASRMPGGSAGLAVPTLIPS